MHDKTIAVFTLLLLLFSFSNTSAQGPVLNGPDVNPQPGETFRYLVWDSATTNLYPIGGNGGGLTWDYSGATQSDTVDLESYSPSINANASYFPNADVLIKLVGNTTAVDFFEANASHWAWAGNSGFGDNVLVFNDVEEFLRFPMSFGTNYTDTFSAHELNTVTGDTVGTRTGTLSVDANTYGTLILPYGTFNDVLRVSYEEDFTDLDSSGITTTLNSEFYFYYVEGYHQPIMMRYEFFFLGVLVQYSRMLSAQTVAAHEPLLDQTSFFMYPNPTSEQVNLRYVMENAGEVSLRVVDLQGKVVHAENHGKQTTGPHELSVDLNAVPAGLYMLQLQAGESKAIRRLQVQ